MIQLLTVNKLLPLKFHGNKQTKNVGHHICLVYKLINSGAYKFSFSHLKNDIIPVSACMLTCVHFVVSIEFSPVVRIASIEDK